MRYIIAGLTIIVLLLIAAVLPVQARQKHQHIAGVILKQGTGEARVTISVVDLGPSRKYSAKVFRRGVTIRDDMGRQVTMKGDAKLLYQGRTFQVFKVTNAKLVKRGKIIRVTHLSVGVFTGDDWAHWYDDGYVCASPQAPLADCLEMWKGQ